MAKANSLISSEISFITKLLNMKYDDNDEIFQKGLKKIKPFKKVNGDVPIELLEKLIYKYEMKYSVMIDYICPIFMFEAEPMYSVKVRNTDTREFLPSVYGTSIYETLCKVCLLYYMEITLKENIGLKDWSKRNEG